MTKKFHEELKKLKKHVIKMGELSINMLTNSVEALKKIDIDLADKVISNKKQLADMNLKVQEEALRLIALYQPMAKDMRTIACCLKMITDLNRIGRYGKDIAKVTKEIYPGPHIKEIISIPQMNDIVCGMVRDAFTAFTTEDLSLLKDFSARDNNVDALRYSIFRECITYMMENPKNITICTNYILVARYLERCGDHACEMAEDVIYMETGKLVDIK